MIGQRLVRPAFVCLLAASLLAGPGQSMVQAARQAKITQVAIATPGKANNLGWDEQGVLGAKAAGAAFHAKVVVADNIGYTNVEPVLRQLASGGASFLIAQASGYSTLAPRVAQQFHVPVITYDVPKNLKKGLVSDIETKSQEGSYLAGVLAAKTSKTGTIGIVISAADINWFKESGGYIAGARSVNPKIKILYAQIGQAGYDDAAGGKRVAQAVISGGADVFFGMGDGASFGYLQATETANVGHKVWFIDVIGNKLPIDTKKVLLSSVLWDFTKVFEQAMTDINNGTFGTHLYSLDASDGISLLKTPYIAPSLWQTLEQDRLAIASGKIKVPLTPTDASVRAMLK